MANRKKKNRKSVLITSCLLAALIVGSSTFAWFSSTDEVTNRLSSTADYGVSIVESFTPPANWIPGQVVDKKVYAVNTGSIAAFVREDVSGVLSFTYEKLATSFTAATAVELNKTTQESIDGVTTMEGGAYLAWTNTDEPLGEKAIDHTHDTGWKPTKTGDYIFRRSINGDTFTYAGYHYDNESGKYYKIVIGEDKYPTATGTSSLVSNSDSVFDINVSSGDLGVSFDRDTGVITDAPRIRYAVEARVENQPVTMVYQPADATPGSEHGDRLKIDYVANMDQLGGSDGYDASATAARAEVEYYNALGDSNDATANYNQAKADYDYAVALAAARNTLYEAAQARKAVADAQEAAENNNSSAKDAVNNAATTLESTYIDLLGTTPSPNISNDTIVPTEVRTAINNYNPSLDQAKANLNQLDSLYSSISSDVSAINTALATLKDADVSASDAASAVQTLQAKAADLEAALTQYKGKYAELVENTENITVLGLTNSSEHKDNINTQLTKATALKNSINTGIAALSQAYTEKAAALSTANTSDSAADAVWAAAVTAYNDAVGKPSSSDPTVEATGATLAYETAIKAAGEAATTSRVTITNNAGTIVPEYSANATAPATDPQIPNDAFYTEYIGAAGTPAQPSSDRVDGLEQTMKDALDNTKAKKGSYDDAVAVLSQTSTITIYVNLANNYSANWTFDQSTSGSQKASFYLNSILGAGETSNMLIESVELADTVEAGQYKDMTFDLNVGLESAQVTYADDQKTITAEAVTSPAFDLKAEVGSDNTTVTWN